MAHPVKWSFFSSLRVLVLEGNSTQTLNPWCSALTLWNWETGIYILFSLKKPHNNTFLIFCLRIWDGEGSKAEQPSICSKTPVKYLHTWGGYSKESKSRTCRLWGQIWLLSSKENDQINSKFSSTVVAEWVGWIRDFRGSRQKRSGESWEVPGGCRWRLFSFSLCLPYFPPKLAEVATFSTLLLQAAAYVGCIESQSWLVCRGDIQQRLLPE